MSPLMIEIGLWYHSRGDFAGDYGKADDNFSAPAVQSALTDMVNAGLLRRNQGASSVHRFYDPTDGLKVWCEALCNVPWPQKIWVMPTQGASHG